MIEGMKQQRESKMGWSRLRPSHPADVVANIMERGDRTKDGTSNDDPHDAAKHRSPGTACTPSRFRGTAAISPLLRWQVGSDACRFRRRFCDGDDPVNYGARLPRRSRIATFDPKRRRDAGGIDNLSCGTSGRTGQTVR
jgi:hypothetical protein